MCSDIKHCMLQIAVQLAYMRVMPASLVPSPPNPNPPLVLTVPSYNPFYLCSHKTVSIPSMGALHATGLVAGDELTCKSSMLHSISRQMHHIDRCSVYSLTWQ